jgi:RNA 2',3'-cyclic 3'-phosphodiesterase
MFKRLFFSIDIPDDIKKEIVFYKKELESSLGEGVRWVKDENLHLTIIFLGQVKENKIDDLFKKVEKVKGESFYVTTEDISYFPKEKTSAKLIWITVKSESIKILEKKINKVLFPDFLVRKEKSFIPHITLGRIRQWNFRKLSSHEVPELNDNLNLKFNVTSFNLCESKIKKGGPTYHILKSFILDNGKK